MKFLRNIEQACADHDRSDRLAVDLARTLHAMQTIVDT